MKATRLGFRSLQNIERDAGHAMDEIVGSKLYIQQIQTDMVIRLRLIKHVAI